MNQAIGILGGTFDPIHFGHLRSALDVAEQFNLERVHLIPSARPPHRDEPQATAEQRLMMLHLAVKTSDKFVVDDRELHREGASYTVDTLLSLRAEFPETPLYLILGTDAFAQIQTWHRWQVLLDLAHIVLIQRADEVLTMPETLSNWYQNYKASPADIELLAGKIWPMKVTQLAISASDIRAKIQQGEDPQYLLPDAVIQLIDMLGLYKQ